MRSSVGHWGKTTGQATLSTSITGRAIWQEHLLLALGHALLPVEHTELESLSAFNCKHVRDLPEMQNEDMVHSMTF